MFISALEIGQSRPIDYEVRKAVSKTLIRLNLHGTFNRPSVGGVLAALAQREGMCFARPVCVAFLAWHDSSRDVP